MTSSLISLYQDLRNPQGYEKKGLLKPSAKTEAGYWLYSDEDLITLQLIQVFVEIGYSREEIGQVIQLDGENLYNEYKIALDRVDEKRKKLDGMHNMLESFLEFYEIPMHDLPKVEGEFDILSKVAAVEAESPYRIPIPELVDKTSDIESIDPEIRVALARYFWGLIQIDCIKDRGASDKDVQTTMGFIVSVFAKLLNVSDDNLLKTIEWVTSKEFVDTLPERPGGGIVRKQYDLVLKMASMVSSIEFLKEVLGVYIETLRNGGK